MKELAALLLAMTTFLPSLPQTVLTVEDCLDYGFENNVEIRMASLEASSSGYLLRQSIHEFFPSAAIEFNHFASSGKSLNIETYSWENEMIQQGNLALNTELQIFQGLNRLLNRRMLQQKAIASINELEIAKLCTGMEIIRSFYRINLLMIDSEIMQHGLNDTRDQIRKTQEEIDSGVMAKVSLYELEAQESKEEIKRKSMVTDLRKEYYRLVQMMGWREGDSLIIAVDSVNGSSHLAMSVSHMDVTIQKILQHSVLLSEKEAAFEMNKARAKMAQAAFFPTLSLQAGITTRYLDSATDPEDPVRKYPLHSQLTDNRFYQISLKVYVPVFDRNRKKLSVRMAVMERDKSQAEIELARESLKLELLTLREDMLSLSSRIRNAEAMSRAYAMSYESAVEKYRSGILDLYSLHLAKNNHLNAQLEMTRYLTEHSMNEALLSLYAHFTNFR